MTSDSKTDTQDAATGPAGTAQEEQAREPRGEVALPEGDADKDRAREAEAQFFGEEGEPEVDPELERLPRRRRRRHPVISLVVIILSLYLIYFMREDILFFFQPATPLHVGPVQEALARGMLRPNTYVRVTGAPDRKHALRLEDRFRGYKSFFRLRRGDSRVFVQQHRARETTDKEVRLVHVGQVVRLRSLPYHEEVERKLGEHMTIAHDLSFDQVRKARDARQSTVTVRDRDNLPVPLSADSLLWINVAFPEEWVIQLSKRTYPTLESARALLADIGIPWAPDSESSRTFWRFVVLAGPDQVKPLMARYKAPSYDAGVVRRQVSYSARWDQLEVQGDELVIDAADPTFPARFVRRGEKLVPATPRPARIPRRAILFITTSFSFKASPDAVVILAGRSPGDNWHYALLCGALVFFVVINGFSLFFRLRERRAARGRS